MSFKVVVQPSGRDFAAAADETLLSAAIRQGVGLPYGCKDGACGSCKCKLVQGSVHMAEHQSKALSAQEEQNQFILTCRATPTSDVVLESHQVVRAGQHPIKKMPVRVSSLHKPTDDVMVMTLQLPASESFNYYAGQYVEFLLRDGSRRSYSMANAPHTLKEGIELHIRHMPGGKFTDHVFGAMKEKEIQRIEGPYGSFFLREDSDKPIVFLASGTGFAPIKALIEHMQHLGLNRPATLYWGARSKDDLYLHAWAEQAAQDLPWLSYVPVLSEAKPTDAWTGRTGFVHQAVMHDHADLSAHQVYACGVPIMVESAKRDFTTQCGLSEDEFFADAFTSEADKAQAASLA